MNFYMTALANIICERNSMALLTNLKYTSGLTNTILLEYPNRRLSDEMVKHGLRLALVYSVIEQIVKMLLMTNHSQCCIR